MPKTGTRPIISRMARDGVVDRLGIAGAVREEDAVGLERQHVFRGGLGRNHRHAAAFARQHAQNVLLDAEVISHHMKSFALLRVLRMRRIRRVSGSPLWLR